MAAISKTTKALSTGQSNGAGSTSASTNSLSNTDAFFSLGIAGTITNGTAPTIACTVQLQGSINGSTWYTIDQATGVTTASAVTPFAFSLIPDGWLYIQLNYTGNTGQAVTLNAVASYGTAFS